MTVETRPTHETAQASYAEQVGEIFSSPGMQEYMSTARAVLTETVAAVREQRQRGVAASISIPNVLAENAGRRGLYALEADRQRANYVRLLRVCIPLVRDLGQDMPVEAQSKETEDRIVNRTKAFIIQFDWSSAAGDPAGALYAFAALVAPSVAITETDTHGKAGASLKHAKNRAAQYPADREGILRLRIDSTAWDALAKNRQHVLLKRLHHPDWTHDQIARSVGVQSPYVGLILKELRKTDEESLPVSEPTGTIQTAPPDGMPGDAPQEPIGGISMVAPKRLRPYSSSRSPGKLRPKYTR